MTQTESIEYFPAETEIVIPSKLDWLSLVEDARDIMAEEIPPVVEIVEGLLAEKSKFVIGSGAKSFKTWLTMHLTLGISHGLPVWKRRTTRKRVLYVNLELQPQSFKRRLQKVATSQGIEIEAAWFHHLPLRGKISGKTAFEIMTEIIGVAKHHNIEVIVLDPLYKLNTAGDENSAKDQTVLLNEIDRLTTEAGCTVILNDHFGKGNQSDKDALDTLRGSSAKGGDVDAAMILRKHEVEGCFRVDLVQRDLPPVEPFCIEWQYPLMVLRDELDPEKMKQVNKGRAKKHDSLKLLAAIVPNTVENPISVSAWAKQAKAERPTLIGYLPEMRRKGWVKTSGQGNNARQYITERGLEALGIEGEHHAS